MKKYFIGAAALLAFTACSNDETVDLNQDGNVISFAVTANNPSRAADKEVFCNNALPGDFKVYAAYNNATYFTDETFSNGGSGSSYKSTKTHYWPAVDGDKKVTFVAFRNAGDNLSTNFIWNPAAPSTLSYTVPATAATQTDFIYAVTNSQRPTGGQVGLNFRHGLAQVVFKAKVTNPSLYVEIEGVSVCNAKNTGTFTFPFANNTDTKFEDHNESTTFPASDFYQGTWSGQSGKVDYTLSFTSVGVKNGATVDLTHITSATQPADKFDAKTLLLLPQTTSAWVPASGAATPSGQNGAYFLVKCKIRNVAAPNASDNKGGVTADDTYLWGTSTLAKDAAVPAAFNWEQGKKYVITFVFGDGNGGYNPNPGGSNPEPVLVPISFNVTVDDFAKVADQEVEMK